MPLKIFVSSEMKTQKDMDIRMSAIDELRELGHIPIVFEDWPSGPLPFGINIKQHCERQVADSDIFFMIIDDTVSNPMDAEHKAAITKLGRNKIFYYFTDDKNRDDKAIQLWSNASKGYIIKTFNDTSELRKEIKKSIGQYIDDVLGKKEKKSGIIFEDELQIQGNQEWHENFEFKKGDIVTVTCTGDEKFYADFLHREKFIDGCSDGAFKFEWYSDRESFTKKAKIPEDDDYYLVIRVSHWNEYTNVKVKVRLERNE